jgi:putative peptide zinc metalloprotease protein
MKGNRPVVKALLAVLLAVSATSALSTAALASDGGTGEEDNAAIAVNTEDDSSLFDFSFSIERVVADVVDNDNAAIAIASCNRCQTVAIAIQVVLIFSNPSTVTTDNLALALNIECNLCETLASAYQLVITTGGPVQLTKKGTKTIKDLTRQIKKLKKGDLSIFEIQSVLDSLVGQLFAVIGTELVADDDKRTRGDDENEDEAEDPAESSDETPAAESSPEPAGSPAPAPTPTTDPSPSPSPTPSPSESASPSPSPTA